MITLKQINSEIAQIESQDLRGLTDKEKNRLSKRIGSLKEYQRFLESDPSESFLKSEFERINKIVKSKSDQFNYWRRNIAPKDADPKGYRSLFNKETGITKMKKQLKTLEFILT